MICDVVRDDRDMDHEEVEVVDADMNVHTVDHDAGLDGILDPQEGVPHMGGVGWVRRDEYFPSIPRSEMVVEEHGYDDDDWVDSTIDELPHALMKKR